MDSGFAAESRVVFYASTSGAFVDLAADLAFVLGTTSSNAGLAEDLASPIRLDADAPPSSRQFDLTGVAELATIDRAVGVLIGQGHHPDDAYQTLRSDAALAGLDPDAWAARLLQRARTRRLE
jgi:hypothetical protein